MSLLKKKYFHKPSVNESWSHMPSSWPKYTCLVLRGIRFFSNLYNNTKNTSLDNMTDHPMRLLSIRDHPMRLLSIRDHSMTLLSITDHPMTLLSMRDHPMTLLSITDHPMRLLSIRDHSMRLLSIRDHPMRLLSVFVKLLWNAYSFTAHFTVASLWPAMTTAKKSRLVLIGEI